MRQAHLVTLWAFGQLYCFQCQVAAAAITPALHGFSFWLWGHSLVLLSAVIIRSVQQFAQRCPAWIYNGFVALATAFIQVTPAGRAKPLAVGAAKRVKRLTEQQALANDLS